MFRLTSISTALFLAACGTTMTNETATVVEPLVGKTLVAGNSTFLFNADGTVGGNIGGGGAIKGEYSADGAEVCSSYTAPAQLVDLGEICSVPVIDDDTVIFNRRDGSQSPLYTIEG